MQILVTTDESICCDDELVRRVEGVIQGRLERFGSRISQVEVHLSDLNSEQVGEADKGCRIEARLDGLEVEAGHRAPTLAEAIHDAADKLRRLVAERIRNSAAEAAAAADAGALPVEQDALAVQQDA